MTAVTERRMTLASIQRGRQPAALRMMLTGTSGVGKTTFGSQAPGAILICTEDGASQLDVPRFPLMTSWSEVREALSTLASTQHDYRTVVVDTVDGLEPLIWRDVCAKAGKADIEAFGYGKGYVAALDEWRRLLWHLETLHGAGMNVILLAHTRIRAFNDPASDAPYDRYEVKLHPTAGALLSEWCDVVAFATSELYVTKGTRRAVGDGTRVMHTTYMPGWNAKNRYGLPPTLPLSWEEFWAAVQSATGGAELSDLREKVRMALERVQDEKRRKGGMTQLERCGGDISKLRVLCNKVEAALLAQDASKPEEAA